MTFLHSTPSQNQHSVATPQALARCAAIFLYIIMVLEVFCVPLPIPAGGSDYVPIAGEVVAASRMPNGVVTTTVTIIQDDTVELNETFSVVGMVVESGLIGGGTGREFPVVFQSPLDISITSNDGKSLSFVMVLTHLQPLASIH